MMVVLAACKMERPEVALPGCADITCSMSCLGAQANELDDTLIIQVPANMTRVLIKLFSTPTVGHSLQDMGHSQE